MKKLTFTFLAALLLLCFSCTKDDLTQNNTENGSKLSSDQETLAWILSQGFDRKNIVEHDDCFVVEGDMVFLKNMEVPTRQSVGFDATRQRNVIVQDDISNIGIYLDPTDFGSKLSMYSELLDEAISEFNAVGTRLNFYRVYDKTELYRITIKADLGWQGSIEDDEPYLGLGVAPYWSSMSPAPEEWPGYKPGSWIKLFVNTIEYYNKSRKSILRTIIHEIGHTIGLKHNDEKGQNIVNIEGTPENGDTGSIMGKYNEEYNGFSFYDIVALLTLYPNPNTKMPTEPTILTFEIDENTPAENQLFSAIDRLAYSWLDIIKDTVTIEYNGIKYKDCISNIPAISLKQGISEMKIWAEKMMLIFYVQGTTTKYPVTKCHFSKDTEYPAILFESSYLEEITFTKPPLITNVFMNETFFNTPLKEIPKGLFDRATNARYFIYTFLGCANLTAIPEDLFKYNTNVYDFNGVFRGCKNLTAIPEDLFKYNTKAFGFSNCFQDAGLTQIPAGLFQYNINATTFRECFWRCDALTTIPVGLFDNNNKAEDFYGCFGYCYDLQTIIPLWEKFPNADGRGCYSLASGGDNIPANWR